MNCNQCGSEIQDGQLTCPVCGAYVGSAQQTDMQNNYQQPYQQNMQNNYQQPYQQNSYSAPQKQLGMGWFKFVIYVQLFLNAFLNGITAFMLFSGAQYNDGSYDMSELVYSVYDGLQAVDVTYGVCLLGLVVFAIVVRFMLAGYKTKGPISYFILLALNLLFAIIYIIAVSAVTDLSVGGMLSSSFYINVITSIVLLCANIVYFKNRKHLFVN